MISIFTVIAAALSAVVGWIVKRILNAILMSAGVLKKFRRNPAQEAVNAERRMAQAQVDTPDQEQAVKELEDGTA